MIFIASDHRGYEVKEKLKELFAGAELCDLGTHSDERVDSLDFAKLVCSNVLSSEGSVGILICYTGVNMCIASNKIKGIRAAQIFTENMARLAKEHNNLNILCFGSIDQTPEQIYKLLKIFLGSSFLGGRYKRRNDELEKL